MTRKEQYEQLTTQIVGLIKDETNLIGILANVSAALHEPSQSVSFGWAFISKHMAIC